MELNQIERIKKIVEEQLEIPYSHIVDDADLFKDLGADSFDIANIISEIEVGFGVSIPYAEAIHIITFKELIEHTNKKLEKNDI